MDFGAKSERYFVLKGQKNIRRGYIWISKTYYLFELLLGKHTDFDVIYVELRCFLSVRHKKAAKYIAAF